MEIIKYSRIPKVDKDIYRERIKQLERNLFYY